jgi:flagellar hook-associated protein 1
MRLDGALSIAAGGLANVNRQMAIVSQNVANANTPGYAAEIATQTSVTADGQGLGVRSGPAIRNLDTMLQGELFSQNATVAGLQTRQNALQAIDAVQGTPGQGSDIASLLGQLHNQFSTLLNDPSSAPQQSQVVSTATTLAQGVNTLSDAYATQRQTAQDNIVGEVATLNSALGTIDGLSNKIVALKTSGLSTADLENQRDAALANLSQLVDIKVLGQPNGDVMIATTAGLMLPTRGMDNPFTVAGSNVQPGAYYPKGGIEGIMLGGADVTSQLRGGQIGANITLRDVTLPTDQAELDEFAQNLSGQFAASGLKLFTKPDGTLPVKTPPPAQQGYVGFAGTIQVNPDVQDDPSLVRDGTPSVNVNPKLAGFTDVIDGGNLRAPYVAPSTLGQLASTMVASQAQESAATTTQADTELAVQSTLASKLSAQSGVNMDNEMARMIQLQNAYAANARVIATIQSMWTQLLQAVQ